MGRGGDVPSVCQRFEALVPGRHQTAGLQCVSPSTPRRCAAFSSNAGLNYPARYSVGSSSTVAGNLAPAPAQTKAKPGLASALPGPPVRAMLPVTISPCCCLPACSQQCCQLLRKRGGGPDSEVQGVRQPWGHRQVLPPPVPHLLPPPLRSEVQSGPRWVTLCACLCLAAVERRVSNITSDSGEECGHAWLPEHGK